jgi:hypothetical protein
MSIEIVVIGGDFQGLDDVKALVVLVQSKVVIWQFPA